MNFAARRMPQILQENRLGNEKQYFGVLHFVQFEDVLKTITFAFTPIQSKI